MSTVFYIAHTCFGTTSRHLQEYDTKTSFNIEHTYVDTKTYARMFIVFYFTAVCSKVLVSAP
jgi:hypothetical protein